jgi:hypothetical protein
MFTEAAFEAAAEETARINNVPLAMARAWLAEIGDTPEVVHKEEHRSPALALP